MRDPLNFLVDAIEYDFCEDDDEVQGNWKIVRNGDYVEVFYTPFDDSPFPKSWGRYRIEAIELLEGEEAPDARSE